MAMRRHKCSNKCINDTAKHSTKVLILQLFNIQCYCLRQQPIRFFCNFAAAYAKHSTLG